jgi:hypothetical protein
MQEENIIQEGIVEIFCLCYKVSHGLSMVTTKTYRLFRIRNRKTHRKSLPKAGKSAMQDRHS